jgi:hypothetical protein
MCLALVLGLLLLSFIPFVHALQIHHIFADVEHDGHQHSDFDLCQWTQQHTGNTLVWDSPNLVHLLVVTDLLPFNREKLPLSFPLFLFHPRGPPISFFS